MKIRVILMAALLSIVLVVSNSLAQTLKQKEPILQKEPVLKVLAEPVTKPAVETVKPIIKEPLLVKPPEEKAPLTILEKESTPLNEKLMVADSLDVQNIKDIKEIKKISENLVMNSDNMIENIDMSDKLMNKLVSDEIEKVKIAEQNVIEAKAEELTVIEKVINEHYQALEIKSDLAVKTSEAIVDAQELKSKLEETNKAVLATNNLEQAKQELTNMLNTSKELNTIKTDIVNDVKIIENDLRAKDPVGDEDKDNIINLMDAKPFEPQILEEAKVLKEEIIIPKTEIIEPTEKPKLTIQVPSFPEKAELTIQPPVEEEKEVSVAIVRNLDVLNQMVDLRIKEEEKIKEEIATENNKNPEDVKDPEVAVAREINAELV
ncbi:MAG: hypothetical protein KKA19_06535, partial [Candidatus Margulisbacteria bacterium]|nr:hypothetical protein [Candidatus Margulisiibacteriota bacterium]